MERIEWLQNKNSPDGLAIARPTFPPRVATQCMYYLTIFNLTPKIHPPPLEGGGHSANIIIQMTIIIKTNDQ